jgi:hypothetical protein
MGSCEGRDRWLEQLDADVTPLAANSNSQTVRLCAAEAVPLAEHNVMRPEAATRRRRQLPKSLQLSIFRRDGWLCCWCKKPVVFAPMMRLLQMEVRNAGDNGCGASVGTGSWGEGLFQIPAQSP